MNSVYSPSHVTEDTNSLDGDATSSFYHDDRHAISYNPSENSSFLLRSRFSDEEEAESVVNKPTEDLRLKLAKKKRDRRSRSRDRRSRKRSYSRSGSRDRRRSHSRLRHKKKSSRSSRTHSHRSRSRSRHRSDLSGDIRSHKGRNYEDIEIRIKNDSNSKTTVASPLSRIYDKYQTDHQKKLEDFKKMLENSLGVSVDSVVKNILTTKSSNEIKNMLNVDINKVKKNSAEPISVARPYGKILKSVSYEQCMHCGHSFNPSSPPRPCQKCNRPRDTASFDVDGDPLPLETSISPEVLEKLSEVLLQVKSMSAPNDLPSSLPMMPPGPIPHFPPPMMMPSANAQMNMPPPFISMPPGPIPPGPIMLPWHMPPGPMHSGHIPSGPMPMFPPMPTHQPTIPTSQAVMPPALSVLPSIPGHTLIRAGCPAKNVELFKVGDTSFKLEASKSSQKGAFDDDKINPTVSQASCSRSFATSDQSTKTIAGHTLIRAGCPARKVEILEVGGSSCTLESPKSSQNGTIQDDKIIPAVSQASSSGSFATSDDSTENRLDNQSFDFPKPVKLDQLKGTSITVPTTTSESANGSQHEPPTRKMKDPAELLKTLIRR